MRNKSIYLLLVFSFIFYILIGFTYLGNILVSYKQYITFYIEHYMSGKQNSWDIIECTVDGIKVKMTRAGCITVMNSKNNLSENDVERFREDKYNQILKNTKCPLTNNLPETSLYSFYTVLPNDNLTSISEKLLGNISHKNAIYNINKFYYLDFYTSKVIKPGQVLRVPLAKLSNAENAITGMAAVVYELSDNILNYGSSNQLNSYGSIYPNNFTQLIGINNWKELKPGDCINIYDDSTKSEMWLIEKNNDPIKNDPTKQLSMPSNTPKQMIIPPRTKIEIGTSTWLDKSYSYYDPNLDLTFKIPNGWKIENEPSKAGLGMQDRDIRPLGKDGCFKNSLPLFKDPKNCESALTYALYISNTKDYPEETRMIIMGVSNGFGGACPYTWEKYEANIKINNKNYSITSTKNSKGHYLDCYAWPIINETGPKSIWSKWKIMHWANTSDDLVTLMQILENIKVGE